MQDNRQGPPEGEDKDRNNQQSHNPVQAGRDAIAAGKLNEKGKPASQQKEEEKEDAEQWRSEG